MLSFTSSLMVFVALEPCDMRKGFEGLAGLVRERLKEEVKSGALFVFSNKRHTRLWTCKRPGADMCFTWATSRSGTCLGNIIPADFAGTAQCDGYAAYPAYARSRQGLTLAGCWAHVRRKFYEAKDSAPQQAGWVLLQIGHLYRIEARLKESLRAHVCGKPCVAPKAGLSSNVCT